MRHLRKYGITELGLNLMVAFFGSKCAICREPVTRTRAEGKGLCVDHDHNTGVVRGILCDFCNKAVGFFKDDVKILEAAIAYLKTEPPDWELHANVAAAEAMHKLLHPT